MSLIDLHCVLFGALADCSNKQMEASGIDWKLINSQVEESFKNG
jgi:hypothetical protein